jgi:hypothetical protein
MIRESLLWSMMVDPISGRIVKRDTFLGAAVKVVAGSIIIAVVAYLLVVGFHFAFQ